MKVKIVNISDTAKNHKYIVFRTVDNVNWYYGAYDNLLIVSQVLHQLGVGSWVAESEDVVVE